MDRPINCHLYTPQTKVGGGRWGVLKTNVSEGTNLRNIDTKQGYDITLT